MNLYVQLFTTVYKEVFLLTKFLNLTHNLISSNYGGNMCEFFVNIFANCMNYEICIVPLLFSSSIKHIYVM
jgi:hypothetical protein